MSVAFNNNRKLKRRGKYEYTERSERQRRGQGILPVAVSFAQLKRKLTGKVKRALRLKSRRDAEKAAMEKASGGKA